MRPRRGALALFSDAEWSWFCGGPYFPDAPWRSSRCSSEGGRHAAAAMPQGQDDHESVADGFKVDVVPDATEVDPAYVGLLLDGSSDQLRAFFETGDQLGKIIVERVRRLAAMLRPPCPGSFALRRCRRSDLNLANCSALATKGAEELPGVEQISVGGGRLASRDQGQLLWCCPHGSSWGADPHRHGGAFDQTR